MARSILSLGIFPARALSIASARRKLDSGSPPPSRAAITISRARRVKACPRLASAAPFLRRIVAQWLCPDICDLLLQKLKLWGFTQKRLNYTIAIYRHHGQAVKNPTARVPGPAWTTIAGGSS